MVRDALLVAGKDLRIEWRSRVAINQLAPFTLLVLVLFGFALEADARTLRSFTPGLFWVVVLLAALLAIQRSSDVETRDDAAESLLLSGIDPASVFWGKAAALAAELIALEVVMTLAVIVLYDASVASVTLLGATIVVATCAVASAGTIYGVLASGLGARETILPILLLPVLAPVLIGATRAFDDALGTVATDGWAWLGLLGAMAVVYTVFGSLAYGVLMEDS